MSQTMIIWFVITGILTTIFIARAIVARLHAHHTHAQHRGFISIGKDRDIFFLPGDSEDDDEIDY